MILVHSYMKMWRARVQRAEKFAYKSPVPLSMLPFARVWHREYIKHACSGIKKPRGTSAAVSAKIRTILFASQYVTDSILMYIEKNAKLFFNVKKIAFKSFQKTFIS